MSEEVWLVTTQAKTVTLCQTTEHNRAENLDDDRPTNDEEEESVTPITNPAVCMNEAFSGFKVIAVTSIKLQPNLDFQKKASINGDKKKIVRNNWSIALGNRLFPPS